MPAILGAAPAADTPLNIVRPVLPALSTFADDFQAALASGLVTNNSRFVVELEQRLAAYLGVKHALPFVNGEAALTIMLNIDGLQGELIVPSYTFSGTVHAAIWNQLTPVFADIDRRTWTIDPGSVEAKITPRTAGILAAPVYGNACDNEALQAIADRRGVPLYYDSASGFGCTYRGRRLGGFGRAEIFSFHATKTYSTMEGGALTTDDDRLAERARQLRSFGQAGLVDCASAGINGKMTEVAALVGLRSLDTFDAVIAHRVAIAADFAARLSPIPGVTVQHVPDGNLSTRLYMGFTVDAAAFGLTADEVAEAMKAENVMARRFLDPPVHRMSYYRDRVGAVSLPVTEAVASSAVALPLYSDMTFAEVELITTALAGVQRHAAAIKARLTAQTAPA
jgi:dTDP-4-amino-4,6-dideoxygalactose transaminase